MNIFKWIKEHPKKFKILLFIFLGLIILIISLIIGLPILNTITAGLGLCLNKIMKLFGFRSKADTEKTLEEYNKKIKEADKEIAESKTKQKEIEKKINVSKEKVKKIDEEEYSMDEIADYINNM